MTSPSLAGVAAQPSATRAERVASGAALVFLFVAPFAASAGVRATCLIGGALAIALSGRWRAVRAPRALLGALAAWWLLGLASLAWSSDPAHTWQELRAESFYAVLAFGLFFAAAMQPEHWKRACLALMAGTVLVFLATWLQQGLGIALWRHSPDGGVGAFSTHLVLVAPLLLVLILPTPWGFQRSAYELAAALAALLLAAWLTRDVWTTPNRIVWPALLVVFAVAVAASRWAGGLSLGGLRGLRVTVALAGVAIVLAFAAAIAAKSERFYPRDPSMTSSVEHDLRPRLWSVAIDEWRQAPWLGHGFGREIRAKVFLPETPAFAEHPPVRHGHNMYLNIAVQLGAVGLGLFALVLLLMGRQYARYLADASVAPIGVIGLALLAGFLTKNLTDDFLHRHNAQVFWALNGMLLGLAERARR